MAKKKEKIKFGYKAFHKDLTCANNFQYEIGKTYTHDGDIEPCAAGFHFCKSISECYNFYETTENTRICKVEILGDVKTDDKIKYVTNKIKIIEEITEEWERKGNSNSSSSGYRNSGYRNSGDRNSGYRNSGYRNSGDWNSGDGNSGDWNSGDWNSGVFNTTHKEFYMFNKKSSWTLEQWRNSDAWWVMRDAPVGAYWDNEADELKTYTKEELKKWWDELDKEDKAKIESLPNYDEKIFLECLGIEDVSDGTDK